MYNAFQKSIFLSGGRLKACIQFSESNTATKMEKTETLQWVKWFSTMEFRIKMVSFYTLKDKNNLISRQGD